MKFLAITLLCFTATLLAAPSQEVLSAEKLEAFESKPCTFVHIWANWCGPCMDELPKLLKHLAEIKKLNPVIVDISKPAIQESFSKKFITSLQAKFVTYLKPSGPDMAYMQVVDKEWNGQLPYSNLFDRGKSKKKWMGALSVDTLSSEVDALCK